MRIAVQKVRAQFNLPGKRDDPALAFDAAQTEIKRQRPANRFTNRVRGIQRYVRQFGYFAAEHQVPWLRFDGSLNWKVRGAPGSLPGVHEHLQKLHYDTKWLDASEAVAIEPALSLDALGDARVLHAAAEGWIDLPAWLAALEASLSATGAKLVEIDGDARVSLLGGRANGLRLPDGSLLEADAVVIAAAVATPDVLAEVGVTIPAATNRALLVHARSTSAGPKSVLRGPDVAIRTRADGALVLDAEWADEAVREDGPNHWSIDEGVVADVLGRASAILARQPALSLIDTGVGLRPVPSDHYAVAGAIDAVPGAFVAFSHNAATLAPAIAEALAPEILGEGRAAQLDPFRPARFDAAARS
ncbi:glycine/D-amino acid oxidase-like deaminating enzyme [Paraburkholderia sp. GAS333]